MTPENYARLVDEGYNHIPIIRELFADLDTPLSCYVKVARGPYSYLLESAAQGGEKWSRYSMVGLPCSQVIKIHGGDVTVETDGNVTEQIQTDDPLGFVESFQNQFRYPELPDLPIYTGGLIGYFGYDTVRFVEKTLRDSAPPATIDCPDILLMVSNDIIVFDSVEAKLHLITHADSNDPDALEKSRQRLDEMQASLASEIPPYIREPVKGPGHP